MTANMDLIRFEELAMTHGPDLALWPQDARSDAATLLATSPEARAACDRAAEIFDALAEAAAEIAPASDQLMARILSDAARVAPAPAPTRRPARRFDFSIMWRLLPPAALAASAALGVMLGYSAPADYQEAAFGGQDQIWTEAVNLTSDPGLFSDSDEGEGL